ncbi:MAG TPA: hypothetical protein VGN93_11530 [Shinella sp.]|jgi:hypothetical protein|uniref:hypothetical protein n=1 Tax=Shinella sp. TaxID=1870904 RepID=UPI0029B92411|nr:hypothetical protein [Shinella sp.]MDX3978506.1 hypothetical protein [Shinella sp.]HEV7247601.1 hypothetical protein [Shinella sp.]
MNEEREIGGEGEEDGEHAAIAFPFDRMTVQRFRETFPRARWSDRRKAWIVPGKTARRRIDRWMAREQSRVDPYAEAKGRDAYAFEPILSPYLSVDRDGFRVRTPYSRKLVEEIRQVPFARWDGAEKAWRVPFSSYDDLVGHWQAIEAEAQRCEPEERRKRAEARKGTEEERIVRRRAAERKRRRIALPAGDLPRLDRPIATAVYGIIVVDNVTGELVEPCEVGDLYPDFHDDRVWGAWRVPSLEELVHTWPSKVEPTERERQRGWWLPTIDELREARRTARSLERRMVSQPSA